MATQEGTTPFYMVTEVNLSGEDTFNLPLVNYSLFT